MDILINQNKPIRREYAYFGVYTFILMFAPPIFPKINIVLPLAIFSLMALIFKYQKPLVKILTTKVISKTLLSYALFFGYGLIIMLIGAGLYPQLVGVIFKDVYRYAILIPAMGVCILYLITVFLVKKWDTYAIMSFFLTGGMIEFGLSFIAFLVPGVKKFFIDVMYSNTGQDVFLIKTLNVDSTSVRFFGFANTLLDSFGYCLGLLAVVALFLGIVYKRRYLFISLCMLFTTALNSRTGLLIFMIGLFFMILLMLLKGELKLIVKALVFFLFLLIVLALLNKVMMRSNNVTWQWIISGFDSISSIFTGKQTSNYDVADVLFSSKFWVLPQGLTLIFGTGYEVTSSLNGVLTFNSDVGYINLIWQFGVIGLTLMLAMYLSMFKNAIKNTIKVDRPLYVFMMVAFFFVMIKFDATSYTPGTPVLITLLLTASLVKQGESDEN